MQKQIIDLEIPFIAPSAPLEISEIISLLKAGKSMGPNSILMKIFKTLSPMISSPLSQLINESFESEIFLDKMKLANLQLPITGLSLLFMSLAESLERSCMSP